MNKFRLIQALRLGMLETKINEFAESNEVLSVSIFRSADAFVAGVVFKEPIIIESPDKHPAIKLEYQLQCKNIRIISEIDGVQKLLPKTFETIDEVENYIKEYLSDPSRIGMIVHILKKDKSLTSEIQIKELTDG